MPSSPFASTFLLLVPHFPCSCSHLLFNVAFDLFPFLLPPLPSCISFSPIASTFSKLLPSSFPFASDFCCCFHFLILATFFFPRCFHVHAAVAFFSPLLPLFMVLPSSFLSCFPVHYAASSGFVFLFVCFCFVTSPFMLLALFFFNCRISVHVPATFVLSLPRSSSVASIFIHLLCCC